MFGGLAWLGLALLHVSKDGTPLSLLTYYVSGSLRGVSPIKIGRVVEGWGGVGAGG